MPKLLLYCFAFLVVVSMSCRNNPDFGILPPPWLHYSYEEKAFDTLGRQTLDSTLNYEILAQGTLAGVPNARMIQWFGDSVGVTDLQNGDIKLFQYPQAGSYSAINQRFWVTYPIMSTPIDNPTLVYTLDSLYADNSILRIRDSIVVRGVDSVLLGSTKLASIKFDEAIVDTLIETRNNVKTYFPSSSHYTYWYSQEAGFFTRFRYSTSQGEIDLYLKSYSR